ncbi:hypothetical protein [Methanocalculus sp.]|uniref:hypothetical protein n=1 Tax=Methanocalculus sp. TaxID=2004547 RepID=UPI0026339EFB|nr:hypothetical protein [Methanocalculus sp.]
MTTLARPIDPMYPTNRAIIIMTLLVSTGAAGSSLYLGETLFPAIHQGFIAGIAIFFAWAISRELDPDSEYAAFLPALICIPLLLIAQEPGFLTSLFVLLLLRIVNRTTGQPAGSLDSAALLLLAGWLVSGGFWLAGPAALAAFILDLRLKEPDFHQIWFAAVLLIGLVAYAAFFGITLPPLPLPVSSWLLIWMLAAPLLFSSVLFRKDQTLSVGDRTKEPLDRGRVQAARLLGLSVVMVAIATGGVGAFVLLLPLWASLVGLGVSGCIMWVVRGSRARMYI